MIAGGGLRVVMDEVGAAVFPPFPFCVMVAVAAAWFFAAPDPEPEASDLAEEIPAKTSISFVPNALKELLRLLKLLELLEGTMSLVGSCRAFRLP